MKDVNLPRLRWKKERITKLIKLVRGVSLDTVMSTTNKTQCINRSLQRIIPLELKDIQQPNKTLKLLAMITVNPPSEGTNQDTDVLQQ